MQHYFLKSMTTEDQQLFKLQNEFKKLRVDFNKFCISHCEHKAMRSENDSHCFPTSTELSEESLSSKSSDNFKFFQNKSKPKYLKLTKKTARPLKKQQHHHTLKIPSAFKDIQPNGVCSREASYTGSSHHDREISGHTLCPETDYTFAQETSVDDTTVNELAGYFDTLVHIPKKMSQMAEMMYT